VIVFPNFEALDVFGPLDVLNVLSFKNTLNLSIIASTLDPVSTAPRVMNLFNSTFSESVVPTHTFAAPPPDLEVLLVPGGGGTRAPDLQELITYIKDVYPSLRYIISVCTGATLLARAGVLDGRRATTNKKAWAWATSQGPNVTWVPKARWVVDGNVWTTSGVAAGIDGMLGFVGEIYGENVANGTANDIEYERHADPSWDPFSAIWNVTGTA
jgi:transcriptional regulator GlxA family with amidase domain